MTETLIFVYGTLRASGTREMITNFPTSSFITTAVVRGHLYDLGPYPGLQLDFNGIEIVGEVYAITDATLSELDEIEGYYRLDSDSSYYIRKKLKVTCDNGNEMTCWLYECNFNLYQKRTYIDSGDWIKYSKVQLERHKD
jgi:gamma-glutamylcyclotransferase (GGCT)/AIG2-like uncharacterized protein YtfP